MASKAELLRAARNAKRRHDRAARSKVNEETASGGDKTPHLTVPVQVTLGSEESVVSNLLRDRAAELEDLADADLVAWASKKLADKLAQKRAEGRSGWWNPQRFSTQELRALSLQHFSEGHELGGVLLMLMVLRREAAGLTA